MPKSWPRVSANVVRDLREPLPRSQEDFDFSGTAQVDHHVGGREGPRGIRELLEVESREPRPGARLQLPEDVRTPGVWLPRLVDH